VVAVEPTAVAVVRAVLVVVLMLVKMLVLLTLVAAEAAVMAARFYLAATAAQALSLFGMPRSDA
jgi:hypothetical protein